MPAQPQAARPDVVFGGRDSPVRAADVVDAELADDVDEASDDGDDEDDADCGTTPEQREQARREKLEALHETLATQVAELVDSDAWQRMLVAAARFHRYSFGNVCAILAQRPDAT